MKTSVIWALNVVFLSCIAQSSSVLAQPLELVTLSDKGGLLPPEEKGTKEEAAKNAVSKPLANIKKSGSASTPERTVSASGMNNSGRTTYVVKPGDTLDKVIALNYADSLIKTEVLKKELMAMNPGAFGKGNPKILLSGVTLKLPNTEQLLSKSSQQMGKTWSGEKTNLILSGYTTYPPVYVNTESSEKRRHWVQYP
jgi:hypothetical protein